MRIAAGRRIAARHVDRQHALAGGDAGVQVDRELVQRLALRQREIADLLDREVDVAAHLLRHLGGAAVDLGAADSTISPSHWSSVFA